MRYNILVKCQVQKKCGYCDNVKISYSWLKMKPTNGAPYIFESIGEAQKMAKLCYGDNEGVKIAEVKK